VSEEDDEAWLRVAGIVAEAGMEDGDDGVAAGPHASLSGGLVVLPEDLELRGYLAMRGLYDGVQFDADAARNFRGSLDVVGGSGGGGDSTALLQRRLQKVHALVQAMLERVCAAV
jgi:hypothetical protein